MAANTGVSLTGVGTLYLHRVSLTDNAITVTMIQLILTSPVDDLDVGTDIRVAVANASIG